jgi:Casein kinase II regulatory subunit
MRTLVSKIKIQIQFVEPDSEETWIEWFCKRKGHEFLCEVDKNYIEEMIMDELKTKFNHFKNTLDYIMDYERDSETFFSKTSVEDINIKIRIKEDAPKLYMLIHQRYIMNEGKQKMVSYLKLIYLVQKDAEG